MHYRILLRFLKCIFKFKILIFFMFVFGIFTISIRDNNINSVQGNVRGEIQFQQNVAENGRIPRKHSLDLIDKKNKEEVSAINFEGGKNSIPAQQKSREEDNVVENVANEHQIVGRKGVLEDRSAGDMAQPFPIQPPEVRQKHKWARNFDYGHSHGDDEEEVFVHEDDLLKEDVNVDFSGSENDKELGADNKLQKKSRGKNIKAKGHGDVINGIDRSLPDFRPDECKHQSNSDNLPTASIIIVFHNDSPQTIIRTLHGVIHRTPPSLIKEILLVDDGSTRGNLMQPFEAYLDRLDYQVLLHRIKDRSGVMHARVQGSALASGDVLVFLDPHSEVTVGWLPPLLEAIQSNKYNVMSPVLEKLNPETMEIETPLRKKNKIGGFDWSFNTVWRPIQTHHKNENRVNPSKPILTPLLPGNIFAIDRTFFLRIDRYDPFYNFEETASVDLSFKLWRCGGGIEIHPCSHVGHIQSLGRLLSGTETRRTLSSNKKRLAETWLDNYKYFFYAIEGREDEFLGDLDAADKLLRKLKCKSMSWYWENIYPETVWPIHGEPFGDIKHVPSVECLEFNPTAVDGQESLLIRPCYDTGSTQMWMLTKIGEIRNNFLCLDRQEELTVRLKLSECHLQRSDQEWKYDTESQRIFHIVSQTCLGYTGRNHTQGYLKLEPCTQEIEQRWKFSVRGG